MSPNTTLADLRAAPVVLVGGLNNQWTLRELSRLRLQMDTGGVNRLRNFASLTGKTLPGACGRYLRRQSSTQQAQDYALIARFIDQETGQPTIIAAGLGEPVQTPRSNISPTTNNCGH